MRLRIEKFDAATNTFYVEHREDVEPLIDENTDMKNSGSDGWSPSRNWRKIGSIPLIVVEQVLRTEGINLMDNKNPEAIKRARRWLNENNKFKTTTKILRT